jgi:TatD DNase family protein
VYAIVGVHPHHADKQELSSSWLTELEKLAKQPKVVGIGEIGMDYYSYASNGIVNPKIQKQVFEAQIDLAHRVGLPLQIHNRHAGKDVIEILKHHKNILKNDVPGMFHCFAGDKEFLNNALDLGFFIGFDGNITYPGLAPKESVTLTEIALATPLERMVTETDSPYLSPIPFRGIRNDPSRVIIVGEVLAKLKGITIQEMETITTKNAKKIFNLA